MLLRMFKNAGALNGVAGTSNFRTVDELFTKRNLWALAAVLETIDQY